MLWCKCGEASAGVVTMALQISSSRGFVGDLPGAFHGRLRDCTAVADASLAAPVATALRSTTNLAATVVTANRAAALAALEHVRTRRAGCIKCLIIDERQRTGEERGERARVLAAWVSRGAAALLGCLQPRPGHEEALETAADLLRNWVLVDTWYEAERCAAEQKHLSRKFGIVTRCARRPVRDSAAPTVSADRTDGPDIAPTSLCSPVPACYMHICMRSPGLSMARCNRICSPAGGGRGTDHSCMCCMHVGANAGIWR